MSEPLSTGGRARAGGFIHTRKRSKRVQRDPMAETAGLERGMDQSTAKQQAGSPPLALLELSQLPRRRRPRRRRPCARRTRRRQSHWRRSGRRRVLGFGARRLKAEQVPGLSAVDTSAGENTRDGPVGGRGGGGVRTGRHAGEGGAARDVTRDRGGQMWGEAGGGHISVAGLGPP